MRKMLLAAVAAAVLLTGCTQKTAVAAVDTDIEEEPAFIQVPEYIGISLLPGYENLFDEPFSTKVAETSETTEATAGQGGFESTNANLVMNAPADGIPEENFELTYTVYKVKQGDMISLLAESFGVTQDTLISINEIKQSRLLQIGQYLRIPNMPGINYSVKTDGETVHSIAASFKVSEDKCSIVNNLTLNEPLKAGQQLFVPDAEMDWVTKQEINGDLFVKPLKSTFVYTSYFGWRDSPFTGERSYHNGIDMAAVTGTKIYAALYGKVTTAGWSDSYGNYVIVTHHSGYKTLYGHMSAINVTVGQVVTTNTVLGRVGSTGKSTGPHLHFTVFKNNVAVDPANLWK